MVNRVGRNTPAKKSSGFKYTPRSADKVKERAERTGGRFDSPFKAGFDIFRPKEGESIVRFLPPTWDDHDHYGYRIWLHKYIGPDNSTYLCPAKMEGKKCPVCAAAKESENAGEAEEAKQLKVSENYVVWIIDRDADDTTIPMLYTLSWTMDRDIAALTFNKRSGKILLIDHPDEGYDVIIRRTGKKINTKYLFSIDREESPISEDSKEQDAILLSIEENPIPTVLHHHSPEYLAKVLTGTVDTKNEDDDEDKTDTVKRRGEEAEGEDEEIAANKRSAKNRKSQEDDDPPPRRRRSSDEENIEDEPPPRRGSEERRRPRDEEEIVEEDIVDDDAPVDDDPPPSRRRVSEDDDPPPRRRRSSDEENIKDEPPRRSTRHR